MMFPDAAALSNESQKGRAMEADWKSAKEIAEDMSKGEATDLPRLVLDLWQRVDELQEELTALRQKLDHARASRS